MNPGGQAPPPSPAGMPPQGDPSQPPMPDAPDQDMDSPSSSGQTTQQISGYMGPESGPFECEHCIHFQAPGSCEIVAGDIDPEGCCNLFEPQQGKDSDDESAEEAGHPDVAGLFNGNQDSGS
jgi:hypothetical protein